jgi:hypothetical protein
MSINLPHEIDENKRGAEGGGGQLLFVSLVDAISVSNKKVSNQMAKHRNAVSVCCRNHNAASASNTGGSSSLRTRIDRRGALDAAAAMRSNAPQNQPPIAAARVKHTAQRTAQHARRCSRTCTFFARPRVTRSITTSAQRPVVLEITYIPEGAVASRRHAVATQLHMTCTGTHGENCVSL